MIYCIKTQQQFILEFLQPRMFQGYAPYIVLLSVVSGASSKDRFFSPIGPRLCSLICENSGACKHAFSHHKYLRCAFFKPGREYNVLRIRKHIHCASRCTNSEKCINTRLSSWRCARSKPRSGDSSSVAHAERFTSKQLIPGKVKTVRLTQSSAEISLIPKVNVEVTPIKPNITNELSYTHCLVTVTRSRGHSVINLVVISIHVWYKLHECQGRVVAVRARDSHVFWCQKQPYLCGSFKFRLDGSKSTDLQIKKDINRRNIAVDVEDKKIFLVGRSFGCQVWSLRWKKMNSFDLDFDIMLIEVSTTLKQVYLVKNDGKTVVWYTYGGQYVDETLLKERCYCLDVGSENKIYLTAKKKRLFIVTTDPGVKAQVQRLTFSSRMPHSVIAFRDATYIYSTSKLYELVDNSRREKKSSFSIAQNWANRGAPVMAAIGVEGLAEEPNCTIPSHDLDQLIVLIANHYTKFGSKSSLFTVRVPGGEMKLLLELSEQVDHLCTAGPYVFYTYPKFLAMTHYTGRGNVTETKLYTGACYHVAADIQGHWIFFFTKDGVKRMNFPGGHYTYWGHDITGKHSEGMITLDTVNKYVYISTYNKKNIRRYSYSGHLMVIIETTHTMRHVALDLESNWFLVSYRDEHWLDVVDIPDFKKQGSVSSHIRRTYVSGTIDYHVLLDRYVVILEGNSLKLLCRSSFKHLASIDTKDKSGIKSVLGTLNFEKTIDMSR